MNTNEKKGLVRKRLDNLRHKCNGFTLMELIIVITILAILVTLALLYYGNVTDAAYRDALLADLGATDKAIALYEKEYNALPMVETTAINLNTAFTSANVPDILAVNGLVTGYTVNRANTNLLKYIKKTTFLFKGNDDGDVRGAGMLYYVETANTADTGTASAGAATTITLEDDAKADDYYNNCLIYITSGTGVGQSRTISGFNGATEVATVTPGWETNPGLGSAYEIKPPVKTGDLVFVQSASTNRLIIKDENGTPIYK